MAYSDYGAIWRGYRVYRLDSIEIDALSLVFSDSSFQGLREEFQSFRDINIVFAPFTDPAVEGRPGASAFVRTYPEPGYPPTIVFGAVLDNLKMGYEKDNEEEPLKSL